MEEIGERRDEALRRHQSAKEQAERLEVSSDVATLETRAEQLREDITRAAREWQRVTLARALVSATLARFEEKRQPEVVERACALFSRVTGGDYQRLFATEQSLEVVNAKGQRIDVASLSRGTAQQLYLCMRFGLAERFAEKAALPLMMDEVFVNFDPERAKGVAESIAGLSEGHQVLMFTCHPETVELMTTVCADAKVVSLARYGLVPP